MSDPNVTEQSQGVAGGSSSATGSLAQWQELALAALKICDMRPHPRTWWDGDMDEDKEKEYEAAMEQVDNLKEKLGLENDPSSQTGMEQNYEK